MTELDPTHQQKVDITGKNSEEAVAWVRPCGPEHWGTPCDCQEGDCER